MDHAEPGLVFALALGAGVVAHALARHLRVPSILPLLAAGVALGPDGLGWIYPRALGEGLLQLVGLAVAVILFEGGLSLDLARLRREDRAIRMLVTLGAAITAVGGALCARAFLGWSWSLSILFGTLVIVTGPTVIRPLLRNVALRPRLATVLEAEGVLIDPVGAIVAAVTLQVTLGPSIDSFTSGVVGLGLRLAFGAGSGLVFGFLLGLLLRREHLVPEGLENLAALGGALVLYALCEAVLSESGILAVTVAGVVVGNIEKSASRALREFQEQLTVAMIGILFVLLAADVRLDEVAALGVPGALTVAGLMLLVRPVNAFASTLGSKLDVRDKLFLSWVAPRGIVAAAIASLFSAHMETAEVAGGPELRALVFLTITVTVLVQGGTAPFVARLLRVAAPPRAGAVILGAEGLALALGESLRDGGEVVFVDTNPDHCRSAGERGFRTVYGNGLEPRVLSRARPERARVAVGLSANENVNSLFAREAREEFDVPESYVGLTERAGGVTPSILEKQRSRVLFDGPKDVDRWNVRFRHELAEVETFRFVGIPEADEQGEPATPLEERSTGAEPFVILAFRRGDAPWLPMHQGFRPREDDAARVAVYLSESDAAREALRDRGWTWNPPAPEQDAAQEAPAASGAEPEPDAAGG